MSTGPLNYLAYALRALRTRGLKSWNVKNARICQPGVSIMRKLNIVAAAAVIALAAATFGTTYAAEKLKIGFIGVGPIGDLGYTYQHEVGRLAMQKALGDKVDSTFIENVPEGADAERTIEQLARTGHKLIFTTSFGFMDPTLKVAAKYPNVFFEHATGFKRAKNMSTYAARFYEGRYIQGQIAAKMSKSGIIGYIVSFPDPGSDLRHQRDHARRPIGQPEHEGKDHLGELLVRPAQGSRRRQGADRPGRRHPDPAHRLAGRHADRRAARHPRLRPVVGHDQVRPACPTHRRHRLLGRLLHRPRQAVLDGKWKSEDTWDGLDKGMVVMAPYTNMPDDVKKMAMDTEAAIKSGSLHPFKCPIIDQDGKTVECKGGSHLDPGQILSMNFYVKGIDDKMPGK